MQPAISITALFDLELLRVAYVCVGFTDLYGVTAVAIQLSLQDN